MVKYSAYSLKKVQNTPIPFYFTAGEAIARIEEEPQPFRSF
jgi:hypothetical protein